MKRILVYLIVGIILIGLLLVVMLPFLGIPLVIHGYDGPVARIVGIDHDYDVGYSDAYWTEYIEPNNAAVYPIQCDLFDVLNPCGLRIEIMSAPNVLSTDPVDEVTQIILDPEAETNTTKTWVVQKVKCSMSIVVETYGGGLGDIYGDVIFWIQINDNTDSIFSLADEKFAYIINVYTRDKVLEEGSMTVVPTSGGFDFDLTTVETEAPPDWLIEGGYTSNVEKFKVVKFPIKIVNAVPILAPGLPPTRYESYVQFDIGIDIWLFGYWEQVKDYREFEWPELPDLWGDLLETIAKFAWYIAGIVVSIVIIAKVRDPRYIVLLLVGLWAIVLWLTGVIPDFLGEFGL